MLRYHPSFDCSSLANLAKIILYNSVPKYAMQCNLSLLS